MTPMQIFSHAHPVLCITLYSLGMLMVGSVLNMIIYRLPIMLEQPCNVSFNLFFPRSHCTHCKAIVPIYHNIPLVSYGWLGGHCHACHHPISWQYPGIEGLTLILSLGALTHFGWDATLVAVLPFIWICIALTMIDFKHQTLPDTLTYSLLWLGLIVNCQSIFCDLQAAVLGAVIAYVTLWVLIKIFYLITGKIGMGYGDFKLFAALGAWFGWTALAPILMGASVLGIVIGSMYLWVNQKNRHHPIPFGPYLCMAGMFYLYNPTDW